QAAGYGEPDRIDVRAPKYMTALEHLFETTRIGDLATYMRWQLVQDRASELDQAVLDEDFSFFKRFTGEQAPYPQYWSCFLATLSALGPAVAQPFIARYFDENVRTMAAEVSHELTDAFAARISPAGWLDFTTRTEAPANLEAVRFKIGYPDHWLSYEGLALDPSSFFDTVSALVAWNVARRRASLSAPVDKTEWPLSPLEVNAAYENRFN